jgi:beta-lactamase class A
MGIDFEDTLLVNGLAHFPMQSVYKFPQALAVLHRVDQGLLRLAQVIHIRKSELDTSTWSPLVKDYPNQDVDISLAELLRYSIAKSDNNGCDILFRLMGGPKVVGQFINDTVRVKGIAIVATEADMHRRPKTMYFNWCQPLAMLRLLELWHNGKVLSKANTAFLMDCMTKSENSPARIKGLLPADVVVAHKTGTSGSNNKDFNGATNDVGIITLPGGKHLAIVVYVSDYYGDVPKGERIIAQISKAALDYYSSH